MLSALVSIVGTTTSVRDSGGIPSEKSMRGSGCGVTSRVASQFTSATASWLAPTAARAAASSGQQPAAAIRSGARALPAQPGCEAAAIRGDRAQIEQQGEAGAASVAVIAPERRACSLPRSSCGQPLVDQIEADMRRRDRQSS